jgi:sulfate permease, SulP family
MAFDFHAFTPKTFTCFQEGYSKPQFLADLMAGITVGVIALPLAMAFAIGSGVDPVRGLYTAIIAGFLISFLGGSRVQIGGPTGAFVVIVYDVVQRHGYDGLCVATILAAIILLVMGLTKCGSYIKFIPYPVTTGFTTGIATALFVNQMKDFWGYRIPHPEIEFFDRLPQYWEFRHTISLGAPFIAFTALLILILCRKISRKIPGAILATLATGALVYFFDLPVDTIEKKFGAIPNELPAPSFPKFTFENIQLLFPDAVAIALLAGIESLLSAVVADGMTGFRHKPNQELVAQGIANFGSVLFGGIPATGAISRTTASIQMGAKTPVAGMLHAVTIFIFMLLLAPLAGKIPLATLASILIFVAYNMAEVDHFVDILKGPKSDALVLLTTYTLTVVIDLTVAVQVGVLIAAFLFLKHMTEKTTVKTCALLKQEPKEPSLHEHISPPEGVEVFEIEGPFFFGVSDLLNEALRRYNKKPLFFILRMPHVPLVDGSGMHALKQFYKKCQDKQIEFYISEVRPDVMRLLERCSVYSTLGKERFCTTIQEALEKVNHKKNEPSNTP